MMIAQFWVMDVYKFNKAMSIYSGFATRNLQQFYDKMLYNLISTLLLRVSKIYKREPVDQNSFLKIIFGHQKNLRKMEKRKYLDPKYSELLTSFKKEVTQEQEIEIVDLKQNKSRAKDNHELNRTLSLLGRQFGQLRANFDKIDKVQKFDLQQNDSHPNLAKIVEHKKHVSKRKKKEKKASIKSNLDIWDMRQQRPPQLPSLHPLHTLQRTIMSKTKFNNFSQRLRSKEIEQYANDEQPQSLKNVLSKPPKFRAKMYFK